jgi:hypothetical protein
MLVPVSDEDAPEDPGITLDGGLTGIEFDAHDVPPDEQEEESPNIGSERP